MRDKNTMEKSYIKIVGKARTEYDLKGYELLVFCVINGFSKDEDSWFTGTTTYLCDWTGASRRTVVDILNKLVDDKRIIKSEKDGRPIYRATPYLSSNKCAENAQLGVQKMHSKVCNDCTEECAENAQSDDQSKNADKKCAKNAQGCAKTAHGYNLYNNDNNISTSPLTEGEVDNNNKTVCEPKARPLPYGEHNE